MPKISKTQTRTRRSLGTTRAYLLQYRDRPHCQRRDGGNDSVMAGGDHRKRRSHAGHAGKLARTAKDAAAATRSNRGIFQRLQSEHEQLASLCRRLAESEDPELRADLFPRVESAVLAHTRGEEWEVYPVLERHRETRDLAERGQAGLDEIVELLRRLSALEYDDPEWSSCFGALKRRLEEHAEEEEHDLIPRAKLVVDDAAAQRIESRYLDVERQLQEPSKLAGRPTGAASRPGQPPK